MKLRIKNIQKIILLSLLAIMLYPAAAFAVETENYPYLSFTGGYVFTYDDEASTGELLIDNMTINSGAYGEEYVMIPGVPFPVGQELDYPDTEPVINGTVSIGPLYNTAADPYSFGSTAGNITSPVSFVINYDVDQVLLSAALDNFLVLNHTGTRVPEGFIHDITKAEGIGSQYLNDIGDNDLNLRLEFNPFPGGGNPTFTEDAYGNFQGQIRVVTPSVVPEPVSTVLFITGGATLALRRRMNNKNIKI